MYRRSALLEMPFEKTGYSEDLIWANSALTRGWALCQNHNGRVYHFHYETREFRFKRTFTALYFIYRLHGVVPKTPKGRSFKTHTVLFLRLLKLTGNPISAMRWLHYNHECHIGYCEAIHIAKQALATSEEELDRQHQIHCSKPPIPPKRS